MGKGRNWTQKEICILQDLWGEKTIPKIAKILNRSENAVNVKSKRLGLGSFKANSEYLCGRDIERIMKVDIHTVTDYWMGKCGLKYKSVKPRGNKAFKYVKHSDLLKWLEHNQDKWDSRKLELYSLGIEPEWLKEKRKADKKRPVAFKPYTRWEENIICRMYRSGSTIQSIADAVGRSHAAIGHRVRRMDVWDTGRRIPNKELERKKA